MLSSAEPRERRSRGRFYVFRVLHQGGAPGFQPGQATPVAAPMLVSVEPLLPFTDLVAAWQAAGSRREREPDVTFIAGELCSTCGPPP